MASEPSTAPKPEQQRSPRESLALASRLPLQIVLHAALFACALLIAYLVRFDVVGLENATSFLPAYFRWLPWFLLVKLVIFAQLKLLRGNWRYSSIRDVTTILFASWLFLLITFVLVHVFRNVPAAEPGTVPRLVQDYFSGYSSGVLVLDFLATVFLVCSVRLGYRVYREEHRPVSPEGVRRVLIVGAGDAADAIIREINRMQVERYRVVGLVDDDPAKREMRLHGHPVLGTTDEIREVCEEMDVEEIIIAIPSATQKELRRVIELCSGTKLNFQQLPSVTDLIDGRVTVSQIRPVDINDLLGRAAVELDLEAVGRFIRNRRVLITGAGGSIGSEMCRQACRFGPAELILVEQAETPLFDIANELRAAHDRLTLRSVICDIYDRQRVSALWRIRRPEVVIHAAAHKHVPLMEQNACEAVKNNVLGTRNVADASAECGTEEFVLISTDKAVNPSSVMGATKRVAEMYVQAMNGSPGCRTQFKAVRFGNVLGSSGSVVPTFRRQIARGGPVTVTHPEMTRYFMTIPEASQLVLQAAATGSGGQIFLLDMGEPVRIVDLARNMITLSGFRPGEDIDIVFTGIRPGEKLFEELRSEGEGIEPTDHPKVRIWACRQAKLDDIRRYIDRLFERRNETDQRAIVRLLNEIVPEYAPPTSDGPGAAADQETAGAPPAATAGSSHAPAGETGDTEGTDA
jgi:FlaA1/EpsC-like NDP-sugar epimerase